MWFSRRYWRADVLDHCVWWKKTTISSHAICRSCCWKCLCIRFARVQIKECFTDETLQRVSAYLGQSILHHVSIWLWIFNPYPHSSHSLSQPVENHFFVLRRLTAVPHYCAEYFWLSAAKVWTQPFIILSQEKQLASFSKQTPRDADWSMLSCGPLTESQYF